MNDEKREEQLPEKEGGVSIREIFSIIGKKIWYVLGGSLLVMVVAVLIFMFAINPFTLSNSMSFQNQLPQICLGEIPRRLLVRLSGYRIAESDRCGEGKPRI